MGVTTSEDAKERFRVLATTELPRPYSLARHPVGEEAEDAVQDCLLKAFRSFEGLNDRQRPARGSRASS